MDETQLLQLLLGKLDSIETKVGCLGERLTRLEAGMELAQEVRKDHAVLASRVTVLETKVLVYSSVAGVLGSIAGVVATVLLGK